jgi:hypothetical protein
MDLKKYDELRKKINTKDFEGNNKGLDKWLYLFSFLGNAGSVFFSYFLVFPGLFKAISINLIAGTWATILAFSVTIIFLVAFEVIKRYLIRSFASEYVSNKKKFKASIVGWLTISISIIVLSFYLSIIGSKNLASTSTYKDNVVEVKATSTTDSLSIMYERKKKTYEVDNEALRTVNNQLRTTMAETPVGYVTIRKGYQSSIDKNTQIITDNQTEINKIDNQLVQHIIEIKSELQQNKSQNSTEDVQNIILFIIIACFCEIIIFAGVYFREWFEYSLFIIHQQKFEKIYTKKDRYRSLLAFIYNEGKLLPGDKVMSGLELKELVIEKTTIQNSNKFVDEFLHDMDRLGVFNTVGKRRMIGSTYNEAINIVENFDDALRILENMK